MTQISVLRPGSLNEEIVSNYNNRFAKVDFEFATAERGKCLFNIYSDLSRNVLVFSKRPTANYLN